MAFIRSIIFWILVYISLIILFLAVPIGLILQKKGFIDDCAKKWAQSILLFLRLIHKIDYQIIGLDKIPKTPCIIACKHESMWETIVFHLICKHPAYVYKKELLKVPFYGWYVKQMTGIKVDRQGGASALKDMIRQTKSCLAKGHNIVIFPQGTRVPAKASVEKYPYQVGIAALYLAANVPVVPAALNSGSLWSKSLLIKKPGRITIEFLDAIQPGLAKGEFMATLESKIEAASKNLPH